MSYIKSLLNVQLIAYTPAPERNIALGAKLCYSPATISDLEDKIDSKDQQDFLHKLMDMKHTSPLEHSVFTFGIEGVSRVLLAQLTRHRIASYSVKSQRYLNSSGFDYIIPDVIIKLGQDAIDQYIVDMMVIDSMYTHWNKRLLAADYSNEEANENARYVLPGAAETKVLLTMNARELLAFFELRCCNRAGWEIRQLAWAMLKIAQGVAPTIFKLGGPSCLRGSCREGAKTCGNPYKKLV